MSFAEKNRIFFGKLRNLPDKRKKIILWAVIVVLAAGMGFFWVEGAMNSLSKIGNSVKSINLPSINLPSSDILQTTTPNNVNSVADWKIYINSQYGFEINYPANWTFREYISGVAFSPKKESTGNGAINVGFIARGANYCKILFDDYVKIAGPSEIQNYESLNTIEQAANSNGVTAYTTTWNYTDFKGNEKISLPITYFETPTESCGDIEAFLNDSNYSDIYNTIISTFKFIK